VKNPARRRRVKTLLPWALARYLDLRGGFDRVNLRMDGFRRAPESFVAFSPASRAWVLRASRHMPVEAFPFPPRLPHGRASSPAPPFGGNFSSRGLCEPAP